MPSPETILTGLAAIANDWRWLAIAWHVWVAVLVVLLVGGWRPSVRTAWRLLIAPLISVAVLAWRSGNPFNGTMFIGLAVVLGLESFGISRERARLASPAWIAGGAALVDALAHPVPELGGEHDVVAATLERPPDDLLRLAEGVDVGGVDQVDAGVDRLVDDADALVVIGVAPGAEHHRAQRQVADLQTGGAPVAVLHVMPPS